MVPRLRRPDDLADPAALADLFGPIERLEPAPFAGLGYTFTGNRLEQLELRLAGGGRVPLVLKRIRLADNWIAQLTGDTRGREAALFEQPDLAGVWDVFACPYRAYAVDDHEIGLLMDDLGEHLAPDADEPLAPEQEERLLDAIARLHVRYWQTATTGLTWPAQPRHRFAIFHPSRLDASAPVFELARRAWPEVVARLPPRLTALLTRPVETLAAECDDLPWTLLHGDTKVANFAFLPDGRVAAFDWEGLAVGPASLELGYYLAVNARRLARPREAVLDRYRALLGLDLPDALWQRLVALAVLAGANLLLWQKALALADGRPEAQAEWDWWVAALERWW